MNNRLFGAKGEEIAATFLLGKGYQLITKNWAVKYGEIDIIAKAPDKSLVFVEVKRVSTKEYGVAAEKVTPQKMKQIRRLAGHYMSEQNLLCVRARVDVVAITGDTIELFQNCFSL